jgi:hypothetical protein
LPRILKTPITSDTTSDVSVSSSGNGGPLMSSANDATASSDAYGRFRLQLIGLRQLFSGCFVRNCELFIQAEVNHLLPLPIAASGPPSMTKSRIGDFKSRDDTI